MLEADPEPLLGSANQMLERWRITGTNVTAERAWSTLLKLPVRDIIATVLETRSLA